MCVCVHRCMYIYVCSWPAAASRYKSFHFHHINIHAHMCVHEHDTLCNVCTSIWVYAMYACVFVHVCIHAYMWVGNRWLIHAYGHWFIYITCIHSRMCAWACVLIPGMFLCVSMYECICVCYSQQRMNVSVYVYSPTAADTYTRTIMYTHLIYMHAHVHEQACVY